MRIIRIIFKSDEGLKVAVSKCEKQNASLTFLPENGKIAANHRKEDRRR